MKKTVFMLALVFLAGTTFAQMKKDRTSAYNYWQKGELAKAKDFIDKAVAYPESATDAKVWFYKGGIYLDIHLKKEFKILAPDALNISYDAYAKSRDLDSKDEYKGEIMLRMITIGGELFNEGINFFKSNDYDKATRYFDRAIQISKENKSIDTLAIYGSALCYDKKGDKDKAIATYSELVDLQMKEPSIYTSLAMLYKDKGEIDKATKTLEQGLTQYPGNNDLIITQANIYISTNQHDKALKSLFAARDKEPKNISIHYAIGVTYDLLKNDSTSSQAVRDNYFNEAVKAYQETIKLDSNYFDALFNLGAVYFNRGGDVINIANKLPLSETKKYETMMAEGNDFLKKALPYLEAASRIQPTDKPTLVSLKEIYARLSMMDKLKAINEKLQ